MKILFSTNGQLRDKLGEEEFRLDLHEPAILGDVVHVIAERLDDQGRSLLMDEEEKLQKGLLVVINDEMIHGDASYQLEDGDHVSILMPMAGG